MDASAVSFHAASIIDHQALYNVVMDECSNVSTNKCLEGLESYIIFGVSRGLLFFLGIYSQATQMDREGVEAELRAAGFGYRAKYVHGTAKALAARDPMWLQSLRGAPYAEAHRQLIELPGVGAKVADCVCLMALDKTEAVPIDVHVWRMATRHYLPHLKFLKNLSAVAYKEIGDHFRKRFGPYAGWAQSVLFTSDLKKHAKSSSSEPENLKESAP